MYIYRKYRVAPVSTYCLSSKKYVFLMKVNMFIYLKNCLFIYLYATEPRKEKKCDVLRNLQKHEKQKKHPIFSKF